MKSTLHWMNEDECRKGLEHANRARRNARGPNKRYWTENIKNLDARLQKIWHEKLLASKNLGDAVVKDDEVTSTLVSGS
jgi:hypothetical protein